jgi:CRISPR-associated protein (TIGR02710 family)
VSRQRVLICTVGGSPAPIRSAVRSLAPAFVRFLVTNKGGADGRGSWPQAESLAAELGLAADAHDIRAVPADDPDRAGILCEQYVRELRGRWPRAPLVCDYTGGTKSMSAALMLAGIKDPADDIELQLMRGERRNLDHVADGTERPLRVAVNALLAERGLERARLLWESFAYAEAATVLRPHVDDLAAADAVPEAFRQRLLTVCRASEALAAWDRLDYKRALALFREHALDKRARLGSLLLPLQALAAAEKRMPLLLLDLWHNALRRAARGQYDDAVARCYRLVEATVQHLLVSRHGIDTGKVEFARLPGPLREKWQRELGAKGEAGLAKAWRLFVELDPEHPASRRLTRPWQGRKPITTLEDWIGVRNRSLLAHGFVSVGPEAWERVKEWSVCHWLAVIWTSLECKLELPQLPTALPVA